MRNDLFASRHTASISELATLSSETLFQLQCEAADQLATAQARVEQLDQALIAKYADRAQAYRQAVGKDTGVVHFSDGGVRITADRPIHVSWDQRCLAEIVRRLAVQGGDPADYVQIHYRVLETKFNAWPETFKNAFRPARLFKTGPLSFRLARLTQGEHAHDH